MRIEWFHLIWFQNPADLAGDWVNALAFEFETAIWDAEMNNQDKDLQERCRFLKCWLEVGTPPHSTTCTCIVSMHDVLIDAYIIIIVYLDKVALGLYIHLAIAYAATPHSIGYR